MNGRIRLGITLLLVGLGLLLAAGYGLRDAVLQRSLAVLLDQRDIRVSAIHGLDFTTGTVLLEQVQLLLPATGIHARLDDVELRYHWSGWFSPPVPDSLHLGATIVTQTEPSVVREDTASQNSSTITQLLQALRQFPLPHLSIARLQLPYWQQALNLSVTHSDAGLTLALGSADASLRASASQADAAAPAYLAFTFQLGAQTISDMALVLEPTGELYRLTGNGQLHYAGVDTLPAQLRPALAALPLSAAELELSFAGQLADALEQTRQTPVDFTLSVASGARLAVRDGFPSGFEALAVTLRNPATFKVSTGTALALGTDNLALTASARWRGQPLEVATTLQLPPCTFAQPDTCTPTFSGNATLAAFILDAASDPAAALAVQELAVQGSGRINLGTALQLSVDPGLRIAAASISHQNLHASKLSLDNRGLLVLDWDGEAEALHLAGEHLTVTLGAVESAGYRLGTIIDLRALELEHDADSSPTLALSLATSNSTINGPQDWLPAFELSGNFALQQAQLEIDALLQPGATPATSDGLRLAATHDLDSGAGNGTLTLQRLEFSGDGQSLASRLPGWPYPADLAEGSLALAAQLSWQPNSPAAAADDSAGLRFFGNINGELDDVGGLYNDIFFRGLDTKLKLEVDSGQPLPLSTPALALSLDSLDVGLPLSKLSAALRLDGANAKLFIDSLQGELLGGTLGATDQHYDFASAENLLQLNLNGLQLERLMTLVDYDTVSANGAINATLPLAFTSTGIEVNAGRLYAQAPGGSIRYLGDSQENLTLDLVRQALANYQYDSLESSIDYHADGELLLAMSLQGHNPDMNNGQRINLNLNLSNNIPDLLQSLQAGRALEDFLQQRAD